MEWAGLGWEDAPDEGLVFGMGGGLGFTYLRVAGSPVLELVPDPVPAADGSVDGPVGDLAVAELDVDGVDEYGGVDLIQRPRHPLGHLAQHPVGDPADGVLAQRGAVDLLEVRRDLTGRQALGDQRQYDRVDPTETPLALLDDDGVEGADAVPRNLDRDWSDVVGQHRLGPDPVARVATAAAGRLVPVIAKVIGQLFVQGGLDHRLGQRL